MQFPGMFRLRQQFDPMALSDVEGEVRRGVQALLARSKLQPGNTVAITAGSRGIANIAAIIKALADTLKSADARPFVVPAMGSHGGATAEGQVKVLEHYGITEERTGVPIRSSMEVLPVADLELGIPVYMDKLAAEADWVLAANRVKPHTAYQGPVQSGVLKMLMIGLGNHTGAAYYHKAIKDFGFERLVYAVAEKVLADCRVLGGVGIVENAYHQTALIQVSPSEDIVANEERLFAESARLMPTLPFPEIDLLIIDEIGKDISGTGLDPNVVGRENKGNVKVRKILVRGLTEGTQGNACGIGLADLTTRRVVDAMDRTSTYTNSITSDHFLSGAMPMAFDSDRAALEVALDSIGLTPPEKARIVWIRNTLTLDEVLVSEPCMPLLEGREELERVSATFDFEFDNDAWLVSPL